jgi:hypothetical protein
MRTAADGVQALRDALRQHGGTLADSLLSDPEPHLEDQQHPGPPQLAAAGPRASGNETEYELLLEMILEGSLLHYGSPRVLHDDDQDLSLLLGDQLYALGLARLADLGDIDAVGELADLISLLAAAKAAGEVELADAIWLAGATAIGWGSTPEHEAAKALARRGDDGARAALEAVATKAGS